MKGTAGHSASRHHIWKERRSFVTITGPVRLNLRRDVKVCATTKHDASPNENTTTSIPVPLNDVRGIDCGFPLSPDEYAMRIATQTEYLLYICKRVLVPIHCLSNSGVPGTTENAFSDGQALKVHAVQGVGANRPPLCGLLATVKRDIGRPVACVVVSSDFSRSLPACFFWPFEIVSKVVKRCCEQFRDSTATLVTLRPSSNFPMIRPRVKASRCRLTD
ncbi:hypothetical protein TNCV_4540201 [Trichonephila clavipes]|nr:hypothetical protein TNCV_4540201 [Trichonephila clavipes]